MKTKLFLMAVALVGMTATLSAQETVKKQVVVENQEQTTDKITVRGQAGNFVDANNDKVCDNFETRTANKTKGQGLRNGTGKGQGNGLKNGTGRRARVEGTGGAGVGKGTGKRDGSGAGVGNFVDANKNGICDNKEK